ncbi:YceI family protein [Pontibacter locisalis]|uniref:YceI family protein n=1 Tax=Pontibacter locisalis TaxID=1719035 RepID=A0ABW5IPU9_9BACT
MKKTITSIFALAAVLFFTSCEDETQIVRSNYALDEENSVAVWKGYSPVLFHDGSFSVTSQDIKVENGIVTGGTFTIPIASIKNFDLPADIKPVLLNHLKSPDFFNMALYPNATFNITEVKPLASPTAGAVEGANFAVKGDFTMLGQTQSLSFPAKIVLAGGKADIEAAFKLDRTKWGMNYAADPALGDHHVLPEVDIRLDLTGYQL